MQNKLSDLNNHLFAEIERLGDEELLGEKLAEEINRAKAITDVAGQIINNGNLVLRAHVAKSDMTTGKLPLQLTD
jgi:hypothetical protein